MDAEKFIEDAAFRQDLSLPAVRGMFSLCDRLKREHGDGWKDHLDEAVWEASRAGETWAREVVRQLFSRLWDTMSQAEEVGGDPRVALAATYGLDGESTAYLAGLAEQARRQADGA